MLGYFFFFQAEDGIRDIGVTGVQTCALPILTPFFAVHLAAGLGGEAAAGVLVAHPRMLRPGFSWARWRPLLATTAPGAAALVLNVLYARVLVVLTSLLTDETQTGLFATSYRIVELLIGVPAM